MRRLIVLVPVAMGLMVAACGGSNSAVPGSGGSTPTQLIAPAGPNVVALKVDGGPAALNGAAVNIPYASVTICAVGSTTNCQIIDHVEIDTASYGLRIISSVLNSSLNLTQELNTSGDGGPLVECAVFGDGFAWGSVKLADLQVAGESASNIPVQVIGDPTFPGVPTSCSSMGSVAEDTVALFGANGILGVGPFVADAQTYYSCPSGACQEVAIPDQQQISNPVASFAVDNNGVIVELPSVPAGGAASAAGSLIFGIGTQSNNGLGTATIYGVDPNTGGIAVTYKGSALSDSVVDSGSNGNFFADASITICTSNSFYCPPATLQEAAVITGTNDAVSPALDFAVADADNLFSSNNVAFNNLAGPNTFSSSFDFGLSFFYGQNIYTAIDGLSTPGGFGPYIAF